MRQIAEPVGIGQGTAVDSATNSHVVELGVQSLQTGFDFTQTLALGKLGKRHAEVLVETPGILDLVVASIALDAAPERSWASGWPPVKK